MDILLTEIDNLAGNDLTTTVSMRYRLESDPDIDASYTPVTTTQTVLGVTYPYLELSLLPTGDYVLHTYLTADGTSTGTKVTVSVVQDAPVLL